MVNVYWGVGIFICTGAPVKVVPGMGSPAASLRVPLILMLVELPGAPTAVKEMLATFPPVMGVVPVMKPATLAELGPVILAVTKKSGIVPAVMPVNSSTPPVSQLIVSWNEPISVADILTEALLLAPGSMVDGALTEADCARTWLGMAMEIIRIIVVTSANFFISLIKLTPKLPFVNLRDDVKVSVPYSHDVLGNKHGINDINYITAAAIVLYTGGINCVKVAQWS